MPRFFIGTSGYIYKHWKGIFYPEDLPQRKWLEFYSSHFDTVELNNTFYRLPERATFESWRERTPEDFIFSVKGSRLITHIKRLKNSEEPLKNFLDNSEGLGGKLGPILFQLPPRMKPDKNLIHEFLSLLPGNKRFVFEFRDSSWIRDDILYELERKNIAFCIYDMPGYTTPIIKTADFSYIRFHGGEVLYGSSYTDEELERWASEIKGLGCDVYIYFNNDVGGFAVKNALTLKEFLSA